MAAAKKVDQTDVAEGRKVLAQLVTAKTSDGKILYFHKGDVLPAEGISEESLQHLSDLGFISE